MMEVCDVDQDERLGTLQDPIQSLRYGMLPKKGVLVPAAEPIP